MPWFQKRRDFVEEERRRLKSERNDLLAQMESLEQHIKDKSSTHEEPEVAAQIQYPTLPPLTELGAHTTPSQNYRLLGVHRERARRKVIIGCCILIVVLFAIFSLM